MDCSAKLLTKFLLVFVGYSCSANHHDSPDIGDVEASAVVAAAKVVAGQSEEFSIGLSLAPGNYSGWHESQVQDPIFPKRVVARSYLGQEGGPTAEEIEAFMTSKQVERVLVPGCHEGVKFKPGLLWSDFFPSGRSIDQDVGCGLVFSRVIEVKEKCYMLCVEMSTQKARYPVFSKHLVYLTVDQGALRVVWTNRFQ